MGVIHPTAEIDPGAIVDPTASVWGLAHIREGASVGPEVVIGRGAYVGPGVSIGGRAKIQNYALLYEPAVVEEGVFIGPGVILTNDRHPRAVRPDGAQKTAEDWEAVGVHVCQGASIGAGAVCVAPITVGAWALVAAGAVVTRDVPAHAAMMGAPAAQVGWVGRAGHLLQAGGSTLKCPVTGDTYVVVDGSLQPQDARR